jgi:ribosomal protein S24E
MIELKNKKTYNELAKNTLSEILTDDTKYDNREVEITFKARNLIHFRGMVGTQQEANMKGMMSMAREKTPEIRDAIKWMGKGIMVLKEIKEKLSKVLDANEDKNVLKRLKCKLKVFEWQYVAYLCHLYIDQLGNTKKDHRLTQEMFFITETIANSIVDDSNKNEISETTISEG